MKKFNLILTGLLAGVIIWLLVTLILGVIYQPEYSNDINITVNCSSKLMVGSETVEITRQVPVIYPFSGETKVSEVKTVIKTTKPESSDRRVVIAQETFKETMRQVAYKAHKEAQNEYDKSFSTLLTILTIFGIAWPVIIAMLQFKFNEKKIDEIELATKKIKQIEKKTKEINLAIAISHEASVVLFIRSYPFAQSDTEKKSTVMGIIISCDHDLNCRVRNKEKDESVALLKYVFKFLEGVPTGIKDHAKTSIRRNAKPLDAFVSGKEIKELLGEENIELYRQYRAFFIDLYPWKFNGDGEPNEN